MKKLISVTIALALLTALAACGNDNAESAAAASTAANATTGAAETTAADAAVEAFTDQSITAKETTDPFSMTTEDGAFTDADGVYTITSAGTYTLTGLLKGQVLVDAGEDDEVVLELSGATITCGTDAPIKVISAGKAEISAKKDTENVINDTRAAKTTDNDSQGAGAITADCDLKIKGNGVLVVNAAYNNGIHTTKDLKIQNLSLKCTAVNNALKGNDSISVTSGEVVAISTNGDGIKTKNTDTNKNGETRGDVTLSGGTVTVYAAGDGIQAAHDFNLVSGEDNSTPTLTIYTGAYSGYTAADASVASYKGVKVQNELNVKAGTVTVQSYDDGLHADQGTSFDDGTKGLGNINVSGGTITLNVYSPVTKTMGGRMGPQSSNSSMTPPDMGDFDPEDMSGMTPPDMGDFDPEDMSGRMTRPDKGSRPDRSDADSANGNDRATRPDADNPAGFPAMSGQKTVSGADAMHADNELNISGGTISIDSAYEGLEANVVNISGGKTTVSANDDGVNACKGSASPLVNVTGGCLDVTVSASGDTDGIDSNGSYTQSGGVVIARGPGSEMAAAIDTEKSASVSGGTLIILGSGKVSTSGSVKSYSLSLNEAGSHTVTIGGTSYTFTNAESYGGTTCYSDVTVSS